MGIDLVTLAEYKAYVGITSTEQDTAMSNLITGVSDLVKTLCFRSFVDHIDDPIVEVFNGGMPTYVLQEGPVIAVKGLEWSADYGNTYTDLTEFVDYVVSTDSDNPVIYCVNAEYFPPGINAYRVTYTSGYETVPNDLKLAVMDLVTYYLKHDSAVHSTKNPGSNTIQIEYITKTDLPAPIKRVLDIYTDSYN